MKDGQENNEISIIIILSEEKDGFSFVLNNKDVINSFFNVKKKFYHR